MEEDTPESTSDEYIMVREQYLHYLEEEIKWLRFVLRGGAL